MAAAGLAGAAAAWAVNAVLVAGFLQIELIASWLRPS